MNQKYGPISGKIMEKSLRKTNETDPDYVPEDEVRRKSSGITCGMFEIFFKHVEIFEVLIISPLY